MVSNAILEKPPISWTLDDWENIEIPEYFTIECMSSSVIHYVVKPLDLIDVSIAYAGWRFSLDKGKSWFWVNEFEDLPPKVKEYWQNNIPIAQPG